MAYHRHMEVRLNRLFNEAENQHRLLTTSNKEEALALNLRVKNGDVIKPFRALYARKTYWESLCPPLKTQHIVRSYFLRHPDVIFSHTSAAVMHGLEVHWGILNPLHVLTKRNVVMPKGTQIVQHRSINPTGFCKDGANITSVEQTVADCAATLPLVHSLAITDSALHLGLTNKSRLNSYLESALNRRGVRIAKRVVQLADARPDNGGESYVRAVMLNCELPMPDLQVAVENPLQPGRYYYVDFMFTRNDGAKIAVELDGKEKYENPDMTNGLGFSGVIRKERRREALITSHGLQVLRLSFSEASNPEVLLKRLAMYGIEPVK